MNFNEVIKKREPVNNKTLILYFSGVGATKTVAEFMYETLKDIINVDIFSVEQKDKFDMGDYDRLIVGTPVYHAAPAAMLLKYINGLKPLAKEISAFIFTTRGLTACNASRILAQKLKAKNILTVMERKYRSPASDGSIIAPFVKRFFEFEKNIKQKVTDDCNGFLKLAKQEKSKAFIPRFKFRGIINAPNKLAGHLITIKIHLHKDRCVKCGKCVIDCPQNARGKDMENYPTFNKKSCDNCYRCIHHCPALALSLTKNRALEKVLDYTKILYR